MLATFSINLYKAYWMQKYDNLLIFSEEQKIKQLRDNT